jgi:hypothetical protein
MTSVTRKHLVLLLSCCITVRHVYLLVLYHLVCEVILQICLTSSREMSVEPSSGGGGHICIRAVVRRGGGTTAAVVRLAIACLMGNPRRCIQLQPTPPLPTMPASWPALRAISLPPRPCRVYTSLSRYIPGRLGLTRSHTFTPRRPGTPGTDDEENEDSEPDADECFGNYSVILPPEPFVFGVSHIPQRPVPSHIPRPPYLTSSAQDPFAFNGSSNDGLIRLGGSEERRLRQAARLAREVLEYAGTLVKVKAGIVLPQQR